MRRLLSTMIVVVLVAYACDGGSEPGTTTTPPQTSTSEPGTPTDLDPIEWDPAVVEAYTTAEAEGWTIESAMEAAAMVRAGLERGVTAVDSIELSGLAAFLSANFDEVPQDRWAQLVGWESPTASLRPALFQTDEPTRGVFQDFAGRVDAEFVAKTGHSLSVPIHVALSDYDKPYGLSAVTFVDGDYIEGFQFLFRDPDTYRVMADAVTRLAATSGDVCVIVLGQAVMNWDPTRQLGGLMHEVTHCHQNVIHPGGRNGFRANPVPWMDEGYASWAGEVYVGGSLSSKPMWDQYFDSGSGSASDGFHVFTGSYRSISFFSMLDRAGIDVWGSFVPWFGRLRGDGYSDVARLQRMIVGANTDVVAGWTASATRNSDFGPPWNTENGPGSGNSSRSRNPTPQRVLGQSTVRAVEGQQRYRLMQVHTPTDEVSLITVEARGMGTFRWQYGSWSEQFVVNGSYEKSWCVGEDCTCEDGTSPAPGVDIAPIQAGQRPDLHAAMFGASNGAELKVSVQGLEDACETLEPPVGPLDACLFGTWNPDPAQFQDLILTLYRQIPRIADLMLEGTIDFTFNDDGTFTHIYNGVKGTGTVDGQTYTATWSGGTYGTWEAAGGLLTLHFTGTDISVTVGPASATAPPIPSESVDAPYDCGPTHVEFDPPETPNQRWPLPEDWDKVT